MQKYFLLRLVVGLAVLVLYSAGCAGKRHELEQYTETQSTRIVAKTAYVEAEFGFWAGVLEPTLEDLKALREAWSSKGAAFPDSKSIQDIEKALTGGSEASSGVGEFAKPPGSSRVALVSLFMSEYDKADLKDKTLGWSIAPLPESITELSETDLVLRALMPVDNAWARYFLVTYAGSAEGDSAGMTRPSHYVISNKTARVELQSGQ